MAPPGTTYMPTFIFNIEIEKKFFVIIKTAPNLFAAHQPHQRLCFPSNPLTITACFSPQSPGCHMVVQAVDNSVVNFDDKFCRLEFWHNKQNHVYIHELVMMWNKIPLSDLQCKVDHKLLITCR